MPKQPSNKATVDTRPDIYTPLSGVFDETYAASSDMSPHWSEVLVNLDSLGAENLNQRHNKIQRILRDDGATYKPYDESRERTWGLDPIPLLLDHESWQNIEKGLLQRAKLFDILLRDIYGSQDLIRHGVIPPESVFANPGFLRPCFGMSTIADNGLLLHAADIARRADDFCVMADRTQSPRGAGYALENRTVMNRVFPNLFRNIHIRRLAMFFQSIRYQLNRLSPTHELPNIVVLTPGSRNESYFEHAYLANYLGYSLVKGRDLTVRNGRVWTKSLGGLTRVDIILRHVRDYFCDPAELKSDSHLGVPGLLEVVRAKKVVVANPVGSGVLESPIYLKYIDDISQFFTGETLQLPTAKTWWGYDPSDLEYILDNIHNLVIKPSFNKWSQQSVYGNLLDQSQLEELRTKIQANPIKFVAQEFIAPSYAPCWQDSRFIPKPSIIRSFSVSSDDSFKVMPGGLARTGNTVDQAIISEQTSNLSKDVWVLTAELEKYGSLWTDDNEVGLHDQEELLTLPSRVVENMFWLGRYVVRAESAIRLLRTVFIQLNHSQQLSQQARETLLNAVTHVTETFPGFSHPDTLLLNNPDVELMSVIMDNKRSGSVMSSLTEMLECAEEVKPLMSADTQRVINDVRDNVSALGDALNYDFASAPEESLDPLVTSLLAFSGLVHESMIRGYGWRFLEIGRNVERCYQTMSLIRALLVQAQSEVDDDVVLETLLLTLETLITYRRRYRARTNIMNGLELTMIDNSNPRSLHYLLKELDEHLEALPSVHSGPKLSPEKRAVVEVLTTIQLADLKKMSEIDDSGQRSHLNTLLKNSQEKLNHLAAVLREKYFDHTENYKQVQSEKWEDS